MPRAAAQALPEELTIERYGKRWRLSAYVPPAITRELAIQVQESWLSYFMERTMCNCDPAEEYEKSRTLGSGLFEHLGFEEHFRRMVSTIWDCSWMEIEPKFRWGWTPYSDCFLRDMCQHKFYAIAGHASSGKTKMQCIWGIGKFLLSPENTSVFFTSTNKDDARKRVWGDVAQGYWKYFCRFFMEIKKLIPGHLVESIEKIQYLDEYGKKGDLSGMFLVPGERGQEDTTAWVGFKNTNVILCADEYPLLSDKIEQAARGNLYSNPGLQVIVTGNLVDPYDPMGRFCEPVAEGGYKSIDIDGKGMTEDSNGMLGWEAKEGAFVRWLPWNRCPNVVAGREVYPGLLTKETVEGWERSVKDHVLSEWEFWRNAWSFPCPAGKINSVMIAQEFTDYDAGAPVNEWISPPDPISFWDCSFTEEGDDPMAAFGFIGQAYCDLLKQVLWTLMVAELMNLKKDLPEQIDPRTGKPMDFRKQMVARYAHEILRRGIKPKHAGMDSTGGGIVMGGWLTEFDGIGPDICLINSQGEVPEDVPVSQADPTPASQRYDRKVTFMWFQCKQLTHGHQLKGVPLAAREEFCKRTFHSEGGKTIIQPKKKMRKSPNNADAVAGLAEVARLNFPFVPKIQMANSKQTGEDDFMKWATQMQALHLPGLKFIR